MADDQVDATPRPAGQEFVYFILDLSCRSSATPGPKSK